MHKVSVQRIMDVMCSSEILPSFIHSLRVKEFGWCFISGLVINSAGLGTPDLAFVLLHRNTNHRHIFADSKILCLRTI